MKRYGLTETSSNIQHCPCTREVVGSAAVIAHSTPARRLRQRESFRDIEVVICEVCRRATPVFGSFTDNVVRVTILPNATAARPVQMQLRSRTSAVHNAAQLCGGAMNVWVSSRDRHARGHGTNVAAAGGVLYVRPVVLT